MMSSVPLPANLVLLRPRPKARTAAPPPRPAPRMLVSRGELLARLETMGDLAPHAPLSFLVVHVHAEPRELPDAMRVAGRRVSELVRSTDAVGRLTTSCLGVVLQGTGSTAASAVAARMNYHLGQLLGPDAGALVHAATGTGLNAETLPLAALDFSEGPARA